MERITLGKSGLQVSRLGLGGIPIQKSDAAGVKRLLDEMERAGLNLIDTARGYTVSEELLGQALQGRREKFVLATKSMARTASDMAADIAKSLANLGTDYIDLYQVHNPSLAHLETVTAPGGALEALLAAKAAGRIGHIGLTAHDTAVLEKALELDWVETVMFPYNIVENQGAELMERCRAQNVGFLAMKPLAGGAIENATLAIRYICANPAVTAVIPGMYAPEELEENLAAAEDTAPLTEAEQAEIATVREKLGTTFCRRCGYCMPCTAEINIPGVFLFAGYLERYGLSEWAIGRYQALKAKAGDCVACGVCESRCPYHLPIRTLLKDAAKQFGC